MDLVQVAVADAAVRNLNLNVVLANRAANKSVWRQMACTSRMHCEDKLDASTQGLQNLELTSQQRI